ncbi:MAG: recombinase family protein [Acetobacteraceae bacterium]|nr:recombinase family protein [Acetobacteraceae bacterium]
MPASISGYRPPAPPDWTAGAKASAEKRIQDADHAAHRLAHVIEEIRRERGEDASLRTLAHELTARGIVAPRRGVWTATAVRRALRRVDCA